MFNEAQEPKKSSRFFRVQNSILYSINSQKSKFHSLGTLEELEICKLCIIKVDPAIITFMAKAIVSYTHAKKHVS